MRILVVVPRSRASAPRDAGSGVKEGNGGMCLAFMDAIVGGDIRPGHALGKAVGAARQAGLQQVFRCLFCFHRATIRPRGRVGISAGPRFTRKLRAGQAKINRAPVGQERILAAALICPQSEQS
jgi:hypothetical protein